MKTAAALAALCFVTLARLSLGADDILIADFEGRDYGRWKVEGEAFGPGPAQGTLPNQMAVSGYEGKGLVNSFYGGDGSTGKLTSPPFKIERKYLNFLIGGGMNPGKTCINLLVEGKVVRTATGPNDRPGGSERLDWQFWDLGDLQGKQAMIEIVDQATGGWGHINIDQIVMSDRKRVLETMRWEMIAEGHYLHLPVKGGAAKRLMRLSIGGRTVREFEIELAEGQPDFWAPTDIVEFKGKTLTIETQLMAGSQALKAVTQGNELKGTENLYQEKLRPQFHFTPRRGWTNDPNGLVFYQGEYHLFFQHNPFGVEWGNMTWGHAVSRDLVHWTELDDAIHPDALGTIFSGSAVVDHQNTAGFQTGDEKPIVCIYTAAGGTSAWSKGQPFTQAIAYSNDGGRTWTKYEKNPVLKHVAAENRDPKVFWHEPTRQWVMSLYLNDKKYALFASPNLKEWTRLCDIPPLDADECPDMFELAVDGDPKNTHWVFWGANCNYLIGRFDGKNFTKESGPYPSGFGANDYAAMTYSDIPGTDGRRIQISWMNGGKYPGMPFNQQMTVPRVLTLRTTPDGIRLFIEPVREIESLREKGRAWTDAAIKPGENLLAGLSGDLWDIEAVIEPGKVETVGLNVRGHKIEYSPAKKQLTALGKTAPLAPISGLITLRILVDRTSVEIFANHGQISMATCFLPDPANTAICLYSQGGAAHVRSLHLYPLRSAWK